MAGVSASCANIPTAGGHAASRSSAQTPPSSVASAVALNPDQLSPEHVQLLQSTMAHLLPLITAKKQNGAANILTWDELYQPVPPEERAFLDAFRALKADALGSTSHYYGEVPSAGELVPVGPEQVTKDGAPQTLDPQFLPKTVDDAYQAMMEVMQQDLGKRLYVESGYRSPAYQLYLFLYYMPKHGHSIRETNRYVALPGYSEHGYPPRQAIDFINQDDISGEDHPEEFENLPEYKWLTEHAPWFGFHLSYPRGNASNTAFEPWHWHYEAPPEENAEANR